ncbi:Thylakoid soluble phosphoprotein TSP9 [Spatholobus suberectus]|nr:Thylakoid soluble phosphoprotein TSP9 [Spatholobus suberectus]
MTSLIMSFAPATGRVFAAKGAGGIKEEKGLLDWILGGLLKEDQLLENDPTLKKMKEKSGGTTNGSKNSVAVPQKKGAFGGLFAKKRIEAISIHALIQMHALYSFLSI